MKRKKATNLFLLIFVLIRIIHLHSNHLSSVISQIIFTYIIHIQLFSLRPNKHVQLLTFAV